MGVARPAFTSTRTEEERALDSNDVVSLKLNAEERADLEADKQLLEIGGDSQAVKLLVRIGRKVLRTTFSERDLAYLVSLKRTRYDGRKRRNK